MNANKPAEPEVIPEILLDPGKNNIKIGKV
jgi:hypothetical protein